MISPDSPLVVAAWSQIWQVTALILIVGAIVHVFCKRRPHLAHVLWLLVLLKCLTPPLWSSPTGVFSWLQSCITANPSISRTDSALTLLDNHRGAKRASVSLVGEGISQAMDSMPAAPDSNWFPIQVIVVGWLCGVVICCGVVAIRWRQRWSVLGRRRAEVDPALISYTARLARRLGLRGHVRVVVTSSPYGPAAMGLYSPTVLLPAALVGKSPSDLEPILAHELIHVRRGDNLFGVLQILAQVLWWFHPLVWWANRNASRAIERCCDEEVVTGLQCVPATYARCLLDVLELKQSLQAVYLSPGMRPAEMTAQRLENIMKCANGFHRRTPKWCWALLAIAVALVLPGREIVRGQNQPGVEAPAFDKDSDIKACSADGPVPKAAPTGAIPKREFTTYKLRNAVAADIAAALTNFLQKSSAGKKAPPNGEVEDDVAISVEPISNTLLISASPKNLEIILRRLVTELDVFPRQFLVRVLVCAGDPVPTLREARDKGKLEILSRPQLLTVENQTALVNVGNEIEFPVGSGQKCNVGIIVQITVGHASGKQVPVRMVSEISSVSDKDRNTLNKQHTEHSANFPLDQPVRIRGGMTGSGKELWIQTTVTEITSREQLEKLTKDQRDDE